MYLFICFFDDLNKHTKFSYLLAITRKLICKSKSSATAEGDELEWEVGCRQGERIRAGRGGHWEALGSNDAANMLCPPCTPPCVQSN